jgi:hypothetical protein
MMYADGKHEGQTLNDFISLCVDLCHLRFTSEIHPGIAQPDLPQRKKG